MLAMSQPPTWLNEFAHRVVQHLHPVDVLSPLACHYHQSADHWEVTVFASATEIVGGMLDGERRSSRLHVDLKGLIAEFDSIESCHWQTHLLDNTDELGAHVAIVGQHGNQSVWLRIPSESPERFGPGRRAEVHRRQWEEVW
jgi:hypothetical protein